LNPEQGLSLDLSMREAEILMSANKNVRDLADSGELQKIHSKFNKLNERIEVDYDNVRNSIGKVLLQIEEKENLLVD